MVTDEFESACCMTHFSSLGLKYLQTLAICAALCIWNIAAYAQSSPVQFEADKVETNQETGNLIATGNVIIIQNGSELRADKVDYNRQTGRAIATGHVIYKTPR